MTTGTQGHTWTTSCGSRLWQPIVVKLSIVQLRTSLHWGQGVVYRAGTLQVHCKEMDKEPTPFPPGILQAHLEFSQPI